jgi:hypothetical protein
MRVVAHAAHLKWRDIEICDAKAAEYFPESIVATKAEHAETGARDHERGFTRAHRIANFSHATDRARPSGS